MARSRFPKYIIMLIKYINWRVGLLPDPRGLFTIKNHNMDSPQGPRYMQASHAKYRDELVSPKVCAIRRPRYKPASPDPPARRSIDIALAPHIFR